MLFRGNAEETIRKNILQRGYTKAIIGLPANLFYGTGILLVSSFSISRRQRSDGILMIDASEGFTKDGPKNRLREMDVHRIVDAYRQGDDIPGYKRFVPMTEIIEQDNNLNLPRYIDNSKAEDIQDIDAHLNGGIPQADIDALDTYWQEFSNLRKVLLSSERERYLSFNVATNDISDAISNHHDYKTFEAKVTEHYQAWQEQVIEDLKALQIGIKPKQEIAKLAEGLLDHYSSQLLIDPYDIYQLLMDYWEEVLSDDLSKLQQKGIKDHLPCD